MKRLPKIIGGIVAVALLFALVAYVLPRHYRVERSLLIRAAPETIQAEIADLRAWKLWSVWHQRDPAMEIIFSEPSRGVGAWSSWASASEGNGKMTITEVTPETVRYGLEFPAFGTRSSASITLVREGDATRLTWLDDGDLGFNPISRWMGLFIERILGPDFETSLENLKQRVES